MVPVEMYNLIHDLINVLKGKQKIELIYTLHTLIH